MGSMNRRRETDVMKLMMSDYEVQLTDETKTSDFHVKFHGPKDSPYEGGSWKIHVTLPKEYPFKSPSIGFINRIYHPNVDDMSGSVCLDLLRYPNPSDPLNGEAASLLMKDAESYNNKVREYVRTYASQHIDMGQDGDDSDVSDMSDIE
ncbi:hypothetical protein PybrP1_008625 [[Pythium] brassicae (nom. inval.)]|nr:hypothetical protein PybrP1_008625 [[Pythium] brassicae (nom. inval.)]